MAVVADLGRVDRVEPQPAVEPFLRQRGEGGVGFGSGRGGRVLRRSVGGGRGWRLRLAGGEGEGEQGDGGQGLAHGGSGLAWEGADSVTKPPRRHVAFACGGAEPLRGAKVQAPDQESSHDPSRKRSEEHTSELQSLMRNSYAVFCLK